MGFDKLEKREKFREKESQHEKKENPRSVHLKSFNDLVKDFSRYIRLMNHEWLILFLFLWFFFPLSIKF